MEDAHLMTRLGAGDRGAAERLFERHHRPLHAFFHRITRHPALAEDLVQETFLRVLRYSASYRPDAPFKPWFFRIARNVLADHEGRRLQAGFQEHLDEAGELPCPREGALERVQASQERALLAQALERMDRDKRELLLLSREPELGSRELAELYGCGIPAIKVRVHRALKELRTHFFRLQGVVS